MGIADLVTGGAAALVLGVSSHQGRRHRGDGAGIRRVEPELDLSDLVGARRETLGSSRAWLDGPEVAVPTRAAAWQARLESLRRPWVLSDEARPPAQ